MPPMPVLPVQVGCQKVDTYVLNRFPDSQRFSFACTLRRALGRRLFCSCPRSGSSFGLLLVSDFSSGVDPNRALFVRGEPMVPFVLVTGIRVVASCGRAEECLRCRGQGAPAALDPNHRFLIPKVGQPGLASCMRDEVPPFLILTTASCFFGLGVSESVVPRRIWIPLVELPEFLQTAY